MKKPKNFPPITDRDTEVLSGAHYVNHDPHVSTDLKFNPKKMLQTEKFKPLKTPQKQQLFGGVSFKKILASKNKMCVIKPYHALPSHGYIFPIYGWSSVVTRDLFRAAKSSNLSEKIYTLSHKKTPFLMSIWPKTSKTLSQYSQDFGQAIDVVLKNKLNPKNFEKIVFDCAKIGLMDFLTNNLDRHGNNIAFDENRKTLYGIDHDRNLQYLYSLSYQSKDSKKFNNINKDIDHPNPYFFSKGLKSLSQHLTQRDELKLARWWTKHSHAVKNNFLQHLSHVKSWNMKRHLWVNFRRRWTALNSWANDWVNNSEKKQSILNQERYSDKYSVPLKVHFSKTLDINQLNNFLESNRGSAAIKTMLFFLHHLNEEKVHNNYLLAAIHSPLSSLLRRASVKNSVDFLANTFFNKQSRFFKDKNFLLVTMKYVSDAKKVKIFNNLLDIAKNKNNKSAIKFLRQIIRFVKDKNPFKDNDLHNSEVLSPSTKEHQRHALAAQTTQKIK